MISIIIPAYYANDELKKMTQRCVESIGEGQYELILQVDPSGEGYSKTTNAALQLADGEIIIVGNNDLIFHENWITELLFPLHVGYDIATCWTSDQLDIELEDRIEENSKFGSLFAMKRNVYDTLGGFDEQFKGYFADTDYRQRVMDAGFRIGKNLDLVVDHLAKATYKATDPKDDEFLRAQRLFEAKYGFVV